ncbi:retrograde regulation protein 2 [Exophiala viscosa]|uniref:retrograde regulation protein 2 n=1 Tax=Exophiala viscosa TaxID=2486360 RepID=UPI00219F3B7C|nr:retrograde regulation protein 2 [Exophiala viscosa]
MAAKAEHQDRLSELERDVDAPDPQQLKRIKMKVDLRICVVLGVLYTASLIDLRANRRRYVAGMGTDLDLVGNAYSLLILVFFPFYICFQPPMTAIAKKLRPGRFLGTIVVAWGLVIVGHGLVKTWHAMLALRCLLGIFEAGFFSSCAYLLSTWYVRGEVAKRNAAFYLLGSLIAGFGGILAYGLSKMDGVGGHAGWRWIFLIEGIITIAFGLIAYFLIVDFPEDAHKSFKFLQDDEIKIVIDRINRRCLDVETPPFKLGPYLANALDWKIWFFAANFGLTSVVTYAAAYFLPLVLREGLGFSEAAAQCLSTPCYVFGTILGLSESVLSDRIGLRTPFLLFNCVIEIIGVVVLGYAKPSGARYFGAFLIIGGAQSNIPLSLTYQANNIRGVWRRAFCSATIVGAGGIGGIIGSLTFRSQDAPQYR